MIGSYKSLSHFAFCFWVFLIRGTVLSQLIKLISSFFPHTEDTSQDFCSSAQSEKASGTQHDGGALRGSIPELTH